MYVGLDVPNVGRARRPVDGRACRSRKVQPLYCSRWHGVPVQFAFLCRSDIYDLPGFGRFGKGPRRCGRGTRCVSRTSTSAACTLTVVTATFALAWPQQKGNNWFAAPRRAASPDEFAWRSAGLAEGTGPTCGADRRQSRHVWLRLYPTPVFSGPIRGDQRHTKGRARQSRKTPPDAFIRLVKATHAGGNTQRKARKPETGSPRQRTCVSPNRVMAISWNLDANVVRCRLIALPPPACNLGERREDTCIMSLAAGKGTSFAARAGRVSGYAIGRRMGRGAVGDGEGSRGGVMLIAWQRVMAA